MAHFRNFLMVKNKAEVETLSALDLNEILRDYYCAIQPQRNYEDQGDDKYSVQSMKCIRAALNRFFRKEMGIDIVKDQEFIRSNEMFKGVCVQSKKLVKE